MHVCMSLYTGVGQKVHSLNEHHMCILYKPTLKAEPNTEWVKEGSCGGHWDPKNTFPHDEENAVELQRLLVREGKVQLGQPGRIDREKRRRRSDRCGPNRTCKSHLAFL